MSLSQLELQVLDILTEDARTPHTQIADMLGCTPEEVASTIARLEGEGIIAGYPALINWDKTQREDVKAVIEVRVTPQRDMGFDAIAERMYRFEEVRAVYLMSGAYDLMLEVQADSMKRLASFVSQRLATMEHVLLEKKTEDTRLAVSP